MLARRYEIAGGDDRARYMAVNRRTYLCELPVETRLAQRCVDGTQRALGRGFGGDQPLIVLARDGVGADEPLGAGVIGLREFEVRNAAAAFRDQAVDFRLKRPWVDLEQEVAFLDARAIHEGDAIDVAADARSDFDRIHGLKAPGEFLPFAQGLVNHLGDGHLSQWRSGG